MEPKLILMLTLIAAIEVVAWLNRRVRIESPEGTPASSDLAVGAE